AEILRHVGEIDFAAGCQIDTARRTLGDIILVKIGPRPSRLYTRDVRWIVEFGDGRRCRQFKPIETEPDGGLSIAGQIIDDSGSRRQRPPDRQSNISESRDVRESPGLRRLADDLF